MNVNKSIIEGMVLENAFNEILNEGLISNAINLPKNKKIIQEIVSKLKKIVNPIAKTIAKKYNIDFLLKNGYWLCNYKLYKPENLGVISIIPEFDDIDKETGKIYESAYKEFERTLKSNSDFNKYAKVQDCSFIYNMNGAYCNIEFKIHEKYFK